MVEKILNCNLKELTATPYGFAAFSSDFALAFWPDRIKTAEGLEFKRSGVVRDADNDINFVSYINPESLRIVKIYND